MTGEIPKHYATVTREAETEYIIEKSRFIGYVKPIKTEEEAQEFIAIVKKKNWNASHNVPVYLLGADYHAQKFSDDGEPQGTAGLPIMTMLKNKEITDLVVVVTRYFGGVKLGTGGLVRAYTHAAQLALEAAGVVEMITHTEITLTIDYTLLGKLQNYLSNHSDIRLADTLYTDLVTLKLHVLPEQLESFEHDITDLTSAQMVFEIGKNLEIPC